jgi:hypothetical protein
MKMISSEFEFTPKPHFKIVLSRTKPACLPAGKGPGVGFLAVNQTFQSGLKL